MKNLLVALTLVLTTATATAATNVKFETTDNSLASNLCVAAAENGYKAALKSSNNKLAPYTTCNGKNIKSFSQGYNAETKEVINVSNKNFLVVPANETPASQVCAQAVKSGIRSVKNSVDFNVNLVKCNGVSLRKFVVQYNNI